MPPRSSCVDNYESTSATRRREARSDKAERLLGVQFRDARQSLKDAAAFLVREGLA